MGDILSLFVDVFDLRGWKDMDLIGGLLLAAFAALILQPLVYGNLGKDVVSLMTPVK